MELRAIVRKARVTESILIDFDEHIGIPADLQPRLAVRDGMQVRVTRSGLGPEWGPIALTVRTITGTDIRMGYNTRAKIGGGSDFEVTLSDLVVRNDLARGVAEGAAELVERLELAGSFLIAMAPHGGDNEAGTDLQAKHIAEKLEARGTSYWATLGFDVVPYPRPKNAHERWHITSADMSDESFPYLKMAMSQRYKYAVAFHGHAEAFILVGGRAPDSLRSQIVARLRSLLPNVEVRLADRTTTNGGMATANMVNRATLDGAGSIQLECPREVRLQQWQTVADAVADVIAKW